MPQIVHEYKGEIKQGPECASTKAVLLPGKGFSAQSPQWLQQLFLALASNSKHVKCLTNKDFLGDSTMPDKKAKRNEP